MYEGHYQKSGKTIQRMREKFPYHISDKVLVFRIYKEFLELSNKKTNNLNEKQEKNLNRYFSKTDI